MSSAVLSALFESAVDATGDGPCIEWTGTVNDRGYAMWHRKDRNCRVARAVWEQLNGPVPDGLEVCHRCDNRPCIRGGHLFTASHAQNMADMTRKGREARNERNGKARWTDAQIREMRALRAGGMPIRQIARRFGTHHGTVSRICRGLRRRAV